MDGWEHDGASSFSSSSYGVVDDFDDEGVRFEPSRLVEGNETMAIASRYFPAMAERLRILCDVMVGDGDVVLRSSSSTASPSLLGNKRSRDAEEDAGENTPMVIIGDMEVVAPVSFVRMRRAESLCDVDDDDDGDDLWD